MLEYPKDGNNDAKENQIYNTFASKIEIFVKNHIENYSPNDYSDNKVIHDPVWGTNIFYKWELQIMDSPLLQRLRDIGQLGLSMLTYPTAHHSRFEHTLGVVSVVNKMVEHINQSESKKKISSDELYLLRLAALLHDIGHCFFSHLSESIYGKTKSFVELKQSFKVFETAKEHEILGYIIINTKSFKSFIQKINLWEKDLDLDLLFKKIGSMIVGYPIPKTKSSNNSYEQDFYLTQIINGQYDADKLDYLRRDSYVAGLSLTYDIDRFLYKIRIEENRTQRDGVLISEWHLVIPMSGISAVEEMAFSQLMLSSYIYQHQKILATDALVKDVVEGLISIGKLQHPCDFLNYSDSEILCMHTKNPDKDFVFSVANKSFNSITNKNISDIVKCIRDRELPKRAFVVNYSLVTELEGIKPFVVANIADRLTKISELRESIYKKTLDISNLLPPELGGKTHVDFYDIYISIPKTSIAKDLSNALVIKKDGSFVNLSEIVRLSDWVDAFAWHKWNAYVFAKSEILPMVSIASKCVFEQLGLSFDSEKVFLSLNQNEKIKKVYDWLKTNHQEILSKNFLSNNA